MLELNTLYNMDCMQLMAEYPDNYFDLAICDPPYGISKGFTATSRIAKYAERGGLFYANDLKPDADYFKELFRVSKNQIIWGYNHLSDLLPAAKEFIFWYKHQPVENYAAGELAWTSFKGNAKCFDYPYFGSVGADPDRIHPTQKPVALYAWLLNRYAKQGDKIIDTHAGSASSLIACYNSGLDFVGAEINKSFYKKAAARLEGVMAQMRLIDY